MLEGIRLSPKPYGTLSQTRLSDFFLLFFATARRSSHVVPINLVRPTTIASLSHGASSFVYHMAVTQRVASIRLRHLKPRPCQQQCCRMLQVKRFFRQYRMLLRHCCRFLATVLLGNNATGFATMSNEISSFRQSRNKLNMFNLFRLCRKNEISFDIVTVCGNKVEWRFDKVERCFDNVACCFDVVAGVDGALMNIQISRDSVAKQLRWGKIISVTLT